MKILITGANGLLGQHLVALLHSTDYIILATGKGESRLPFSSSGRYNYFSLDTSDGMAVNSFLTAQHPDIVIHAAAMTQVDECELNQVACYNANVTATRFLLSAAQGIGAYFVYMSTDFVFDGLNGPYLETDNPEPVSYYGSTKLAAERSVAESKLVWCIIRTVLVYGNVLNGTRSNIINWVKTSLEQGKKIQVVNDQLRTPTFVEDLAKGILMAVEKKVTGIYHISGAELMSPYDIAIATAEYLQLDKDLIEKADASLFSQPAKRPLKTGFIIDKAKDELGFQPVSFNEGLKRMFAAPKS